MFVDWTSSEGIVPPSGQSRVGSFPSGLAHSKIGFVAYAGLSVPARYELIKRGPRPFGRELIGRSGLSGTRRWTATPIRRLRPVHMNR
jgi:hypothetical protein